MREPTAQETAEAVALLQSPYGKESLLIAAACTIPISFTDASGLALGKVANGSGFLMRTPKKLILATAGHVYDEYLKASESLGAIAQIGHDIFPLQERLICRSGRVDVATFELSQQELEALRPIEGVKRFPISAWPPRPPELGRGLLYAGFPAQQRVYLGDRSFSFGMYLGSSIADRVSETQIKTLVDHERIIDVMGLGLPTPGYFIGGMSGGPMLTLLDKAGLNTFVPAGIITEGLALGDVITADRIDTMTEDGEL